MAIVLLVTHTLVMRMVDMWRQGFCRVHAVCGGILWWWYRGRCLPPVSAAVRLSSRRWQHCVGSCRQQACPASTVYCCLYCDHPAKNKNNILNNIANNSVYHTGYHNGYHIEYCIGYHNELHIEYIVLNTILNTLLNTIRITYWIP